MQYLLKYTKTKLIGGNMKKILTLISLFVFCFSLSALAADKDDFVIYKDKNSPENRFIPSGWMGDHGDLVFNDHSQDSPFAGATCIELTYTAKRSSGNGWAGIYWQSASNNWGTKQTGFDLTGLNKLTFWARGKEGGEVITLVKAGGIQTAANGGKVAYPDSVSKEVGPIRLTKDWQQYEINLVDEDLSYVNGGLCLIFNADQAGGKQTIYLDNIMYTYDKDLTAEESQLNFPFYVYADSSSLDNHFIPSGWMPATAARDLRINVNWQDNPFSGDSCIRIEYENNSGTRWAGMYWQEPGSNWGSIPNAGYDLGEATKLTFWARGQEGGEIINEFKMGGIVSGEYPDSDSAGIGPVKLTKQWEKYEIDLRGRDLSHVIGGFCWATNIDVNDPEGVVFYLDEIRYEKSEE
jgi:hypothetical protein